MKIKRIKSVQYTDIMPFRDLDIDLPDVPVIGLAGENRSGKSSFVEGIVYALTGEVRNGNSDSVIRRGSKDCKAVVNVEMDTGDEYEIIRGRGPQGLFLEVYLSDRTLGPGGMKLMASGTQADGYIREHILSGMTEKDILATAFARTGDVHLFAQALPSERKAMMIRWFGLDRWTEYRKTVRGKLDSVQASLARLVSSPADAMRRLTRATEILDATRHEAAESDSFLEAARARHEEAVKAAAGQDQTPRMREICSLFARKATLNDLALSIAAIDVDALNDHVVKLNKELDLAHAAQAEAEVDYRDKAAKLNQAHARVVSGFDGVCPVDHKGCPRVGEINADAECQNAQYTAAKSDAMRSGDILAKAKAVTAKISDEFQRAHDAINKHESTMKDIRRREAELRDVDWKALADEQDAIAKAAKSTEAQAVAVGVALRMFREAESAARTAHRNVGQAEAEVEAARLALKEAEEEEENRASLRCLLAKLQYVERMCSPDGIPALVLENLVAGVEETANGILETMTAPIQIRFSFESEGTTKAKVCACGSEFPPRSTKCPECGQPRGTKKTADLDLQVVENGEAHPFGEDSGAGRAMVSLAVRLAVARRMGMRWAVLDEVADVMSSVNRARFVSMLGALAGVGFAQVFVTSHHDDIKDSIADVLVFDHGKARWA